MTKNQVKRTFCQILLFTAGFLSCKRSIAPLQRNYDPQLLNKLGVLQHKYNGKKVRVNTWNKKAGAYENIAVLDTSGLAEDTLTIGDSVKLMGISTRTAEGIQAKIELQNKKKGFVPYWAIEELAPAKAIDPDFKY